MKLPVLYRKRFIPNEIVCLKDDTILHCDDTLIITSWRTLKPRHDIARGISAYFTTEGFKVSKVYNSRDELVYWYCDIVQTRKDPEQNQIIFEDLLLDVILKPNGAVRVMDMAELADALAIGLIPSDTAQKALRTADHLLDLIDAGQFAAYMDIVNHAEASRMAVL
ncbi:MAG: DUF402 domain-containing protein [Lachnospiraceae bacterium]|nr:DUF402 domain-containing protein [Lachnospiraceae bacterium]